MVEFIVNNYYVILVVCVLFIFAIIGYIIDTLKNRNKDVNVSNAYIPEEEIFLEETPKEVESIEDDSMDEILEEDSNTEDLLSEYNNEQLKENSND